MALKIHNLCSDYSSNVVAAPKQKKDVDNTVAPIPQTGGAGAGSEGDNTPDVAEAQETTVEEASSGEKKSSSSKKKKKQGTENKD